MIEIPFSGDGLDRCMFITSAGRQSEWFGGRGGKDELSFRARAGHHITGNRIMEDITCNIIGSCSAQVCSGISQMYGHISIQHVVPMHTI